MSWHIDPPTWEAYVAGRLALGAEASVETHLTGCAECRAAAKAHVEPAAADAVWTQVRATISAPALPLPLRLLQRLGVPGDDLVVVAATESLLVPWAVAIGFAMTCACMVGLAGLGPASRDAVFLALAPLIPALAVVAAYDSLDPLREVMAPTPYSKLRLALLRATASLAVAVPATSVIGLVVPAVDDLAFMWLAPSLCLTLGVLVLLTWCEAKVAGTVVASVWVAVVTAVRLSGTVAPLTAPGVQIGFAALGAVLAATLVLRTSTLRLLGGSR